MHAYYNKCLSQKNQGIYFDVTDKRIYCKILVKNYTGIQAIDVLENMLCILSSCDFFISTWPDFHNSYSKIIKNHRVWSLYKNEIKNQYGIPQGDKLIIKYVKFI